jgi:hypothetical protein
MIFYLVFQTIYDLAVLSLCYVKVLLCLAEVWLLKSGFLLNPLTLLDIITFSPYFLNELLGYIVPVITFWYELDLIVIWKFSHAVWELFLNSLFLISVLKNLVSLLINSGSPVFFSKREGLSTNWVKSLFYFSRYSLYLLELNCSPPFSPNSSLLFFVYLNGFYPAINANT